MNKHVFLLALLGITVLDARIYTGIKSTYSIQKNNHEISNVTDSVMEHSPTDDEIDYENITPEEAAEYSPLIRRAVRLPNSQMRFKSRAVNLGALVGYSFEDLHKVYKPFVEFDIDFKSQQNAISGIDIIPDEEGQSSTNALDNESFKIKSGAVFGITLGVDAGITDSISAIIGTRFTLTQYTATGTHTKKDSNLPTNSLTRKAYLFGFEPMVGAKYKFNDNMAVRFTVGYNFGQTKNIIKNYITNVPDVEGVHKDTSAGLTLKPRNVNFTVALIYTF